MAKSLLTRLNTSAGDSWEAWAITVHIMHLALSLLQNHAICPNRRSADRSLVRSGKLRTLVSYLHPCYSSFLYHVALLSLRKLYILFSSAGFLKFLPFLHAFRTIIVVFGQTFLQWLVVADRILCCCCCLFCFGHSLTAAVVVGNSKRLGLAGYRFRSLSASDSTQIWQVPILTCISFIASISLLLLSIVNDRSHSYHARLCLMTVLNDITDSVILGSSASDQYYSR